MTSAEPKVGPASVAVPDQPDDFRAYVRAWLDEHAPAKGSPGDFSSAHLVTATTAAEYERLEQGALDVTKAWQRSLYDAGLAGRSWPVEHGGLGAPKWQDDIVAAEQARYGVSTKMLAIALEMLPPVLFAHGTEDQRRAHLPAVIRGDERWCQLLSEPDAGSDLTAVSTFASPVDGGWSVTGQKVWTSGAVGSDWALLVARTDRSRPGRDGVSCFAIAMDQPGVVVRPLRQISGAYHFNEVFLDGAFVDEADLIGGLGGGFTVLRTMLASERAAIGGGTSVRAAVQLLALARSLEVDGDPLVRQSLAHAYTRERVLDLFQARAAAGAAIPAAGPVGKLLYSEMGRLTSSAALTVLGASGTLVDDPVSGPWIERFLFAPGLRIGGGTDEIQRTTIAERGLGLPR